MKIMREERKCHGQEFNFPGLGNQFGSPTVTQLQSK